MSSEVECISQVFFVVVAIRKCVKYTHKAKGDYFS